MPSLQPAAEDPVHIDVDEDGIVARFSRALTYPTISHESAADADPAPFLEFHDFVQEAFPGVHATLARETVNELSLLYTWQGADPVLSPVVLMGHIDVVPVIPGTEDDWTHPPFDGVVADGSIWGRGALDDKSSVMAVLEAVEQLVGEGFQPRRTIYLAFGHDEEIGGPDGAGRIAELLAERGAEPYAFVLDEGGAITAGSMPGLEGPVAVIGIAEKGFVSFELLVEGEGGHSSAPPPHTNIGVLAAAITRLENDQFPSRLDGAAAKTLEYIGPEMGFLARMAFANLWLTRPALARLMATDQMSAAMVRTTTAATIIGGGIKANVLPITARAVVNHRILPGETAETVEARVLEVIDDDRVQVRAIGASANPSPVSDTDSPAFALLGKTLHQVSEDPGILIAPYLVTGGTDAKYYSGRSPAVFRFLPVAMPEDGMQMFHGTNERINIDSLHQAVRYMVQLIRNSDELAD